VPGFYRAFARTGERSRALRSAQLDLLHRLRRGAVTAPAAGGPVVLPDSPLVWAGFIVVGEP